MKVFSNHEILDVERRASLSRSEFEATYLCRTGRPVILTDISAEWPALRNWTFNFFAERYGDETVQVSDRLLAPSNAKQMTLRNFIRICTTPEEHMESPSTPAYCGLQPFSQHPELLKDFRQPSVVSCVYEQCLDLRQWYLATFGVVLIGTRGAYTPLHRDLFAAHGWLTQIAGEKEWVLFSPEDELIKGYRQERIPKLDFRVASKIFQCRPHFARLKPGETIFVPQGWYHYVVTIDASISFGFNFVNHTNFGAHVCGIAQDMPDWVKRMNRLKVQAEIQ